MATLYDILPGDLKAQYRPDTFDPKAAALLGRDASVLSPDQQHEFAQLAPSLLPRLTMRATIGRIRARYATVQPPPELPDRRGRLLLEGAIAPMAGIPGLSPPLHRTVEPANWKERLMQGAAGIPATVMMAAPVAAAVETGGAPVALTEWLAGRGASVAVARAAGRMLPQAAAGAALANAQPGTLRQRLGRTAAYGLVGPLGEAVGPEAAALARTGAATASWGIGAPTTSAVLGEGRLPTGEELASNVALAGGMMAAHPLSVAVSRALGRRPAVRIAPAVDPTILEPPVERIPQGHPAGRDPWPPGLPAGPLGPHAGSTVGPGPSAIEMGPEAGLIPEARRLGPRVIRMAPGGKPLVASDVVADTRAFPDLAGPANAVEPPMPTDHHTPASDMVAGRPPRRMGQRRVAGPKAGETRPTATQLEVAPVPPGAAAAPTPSKALPAPAAPELPPANKAAIRAAGFRNKTTGEVVDSGTFHNGDAIPSGWAPEAVEPGFIDVHGRFWTKDEAFKGREIGQQHPPTLFAGKPQEPVRAEGNVPTGLGTPGEPAPGARAKLSIGDRVSVPSRGRGLAAREQGKVVSVDPEAGTVQVAMIRGRTAQGGGTEHVVEHPIADATRIAGLVSGGNAKAARIKRMSDAGGIRGGDTQQLVEAHRALGERADAIFEEHRGMPPSRKADEMADRTRALAERRRIMERQQAISRELYSRGWAFRGGAWQEPQGGGGGLFAPVMGQSGMARIPSPDFRRMGESIEATRARGRARLAAEAAQAGESPKAAEPVAPEQPPHVQKVLEAVKAAKPVRGKQERLYTAERGRRIGKAEAAIKGMAGEAASRERVRHLAGELPRADFESIKSQIDQPTIDALHDQINTSRKVTSQFDRITAVRGLDRLLGEHGGTVPALHELKMLQKVFGEDFVRTLIDKSPIRDKLLRKLNETAGMVKSIRSAGDFSAALRQGLVLGSGNPKRWGQAFAAQFHYFASPKAFDALHEEIVTRPNYELYRSSGLDLTEHGALLEGREEQYMSDMAERIPVFGKHLIKPSERAYTGFLNRLRVDVFDDAVRRYKAIGLDAHGDPAVAKEIADWVNDGTGRGDLPGFLKRSNVILNAVFFSPRLQASRLRLMNPARYIAGSPGLRREALRSAIGITGLVGTALGLAALQGAKVEMDPRSTDFGKIKVGNTRYDLLAGFQQYARLAAVLVSGTQKAQGGAIQKLNTKDRNRAVVAGRFVRNKLSPAASMAIDLATGFDTSGQKIKPLPYVAQQFTPLVWQDMWDAMKEWGPAGAAIASPTIFGVGVQTYGGHRNRMRGILQEQPTAPTQAVNP